MCDVVGVAIMHKYACASLYSLIEANLKSNTFAVNKGGGIHVEFYKCNLYLC